MAGAWLVLNEWLVIILVRAASVTIEKMSLEGHTGVLIPKSMSYVDKSK